uniref:Uncharacterized protein n=1 Tax=Acrobeloides nanus TaxID=290746 RepID=A0A914C0Q9_9BILA
MKIFYLFLFATILSILQASSFEESLEYESYESFEEEERRLKTKNEESYDEDEFLRSIVQDFFDDQKFKEDQFDPDIVKIYFKLTEKERQCFFNGSRLVKETIAEKGFDKAMEFVDNYCPSIHDNAEILYSWLQNFAKKTSDFFLNFHVGLPESIQAPLMKIGNVSKWMDMDENDEYEDQNIFEIYKVLDQILNASEEDRNALAKKHPFMAPFVIGKLRADSIIIVRNVIIMYKNESSENSNLFEAAEAFENWFVGLKQELLEYFNTRQRPDKVLKGGMDRLITIVLGQFYDSLNFDSIGELYEVYENKRW